MTWLIAYIALSISSASGKPNDKLQTGTRGVQVMRVGLSHRCPDLTLDLTLHPSGAITSLNGGLIETDELASLVESLEITIKPNTATLRLIINKSERTPPEMIANVIKALAAGTSTKKRALVFLVE